MAFRIEKRAGALVIGMALLAGPSCGQQLEYQVWRGKSRVVNLPPRIRKVGNMGNLTI